MGGFLDEVESLFKTRCLYDVLGIKKETFNAKDLKKQYYKKALIYHPDKCTNDKDRDKNTQKFRVISKIYSVLSDDELRAIYNEKGQLIEDEELVEHNKDWTAYWRCVFKKITKADIEEFENEFKNSEEELRNLKDSYIKFEGNMDLILDSVLCSTIDDEPRFREIIEKCIESKELPSFEAFVNEDKKKLKKRKRKAESEKKESEELVKELGLEVDGDLKALIASRNATREKEMNSFFDNLEAKYCQPKKKVKTTSKSKSSSSKITKTKVPMKAKSKRK